MCLKSQEAIGFRQAVRDRLAEPFGSCFVKSTAGKSCIMDKGIFTTGTRERYLEDFIEGAVHEFGPVAVTEEEIIEFGRKYDPQLFHTDPDASRETVYGGLIASGWHTCSLFMRMFVEHYLPGPASLGSPGVDQLRWLKPVRPGEKLWLRVTVHKVKPSASKPDRGVLFSLCEMVNHKREVVTSMMAMNLIRYRNSRAEHDGNHA